MPTETSQPLKSPGLRQIREDGCLSYVLWDRTAREAIAIDASFAALEAIRELLQQEMLRLVAVVDTHTHADHPSCSHQLRRETGARVVMGRGTTSARADRLVSAGDEIAAGSIRLKVLETPGHTPDSLCLVESDAGGRARLAFTGDTLLIGATGRTDFPSADPSALFRSLRLLDEVLLPDTRILPAHDYGDLLFSLWGTEKAKNPHLQIHDEAAFVAMKREESLAVLSEEVHRLIRFNLTAEPDPQDGGVGGAGVAACGAAPATSERVPAISVEKYALKIEGPGRGNFFVDVREADEFAAGHMPGVENIPLSELALEWPRVSQASKVYLSCQAGRRSRMAAMTLDRLGISGVVNVSGGFQGWLNAGLPVEK